MTAGPTAARLKEQRDLNPMAKELVQVLCDAFALGHGQRLDIETTKLKDFDPDASFPVFVGHCARMASRT